MKFTTAALVILSASSAHAFAPRPFGTPTTAKAHLPSRKHYLRTPTTTTTQTSQSKWGLMSTTDVTEIVESAFGGDFDDDRGDSNCNLAQSAEEIRAAAASYLAQYEGKSGAHALYTKLQENGVTVVNGYSGGAVLPILDQFHEGHPRHQSSNKKPIRWITNSNEQNAGHVTEGFAKAQPVNQHFLPVGVCVATSGPGVTNLITPLQDAICDGVPMVVLCGQAATVAPADAFQSSPAVELTTPCTKWSYQVKSAAEIPLALDYAFYVARNGRPGPVFVDLPKDLQNQIISEDLIESMVTTSLTEDSADEFARLAIRQRSDGSSFQAIHLGKEGKGLAFDIQEATDGSLELTHVQTTGTGDMFDTDHNPQDVIYHSEDSVVGAENHTWRQAPIDSGMLTEITELLSSAKRPIIIAGQGCNDCPEDLKRLAETLQIPVTTTLHALGTFDERSDLALNMMGMHGHPTPNFMVQESDLIVCIGSRFDDRITGRIGDFIPEARKAAQEGRGGIIHVDIRLSEKAKQVSPTYFVHSTGKTFLRAINKALEDPRFEGTNTSNWLQKMKVLKEQYPIGIPKFPTQMVPVESEDSTQSNVDKTPMSAQLVVQDMNLKLLKANKIDDCIFTTGVGIHQMVAAQLITWTQPRQMLSSGSLGTMGVSLGYAVGAKLAQEGKCVISVDGDGSFNMTFTELKTLMEQDIPIKLLILDNEAQMMVEYWQRLFHDKRYLAVRNTNPAYTKLAEAFGIKSLYCDRAEDLSEKMKQFLFDDPDKPVLFHVRIERTPCLPLVAPGQALENMILEDEDFEVDPAAAPS